MIFSRVMEQRANRFVFAPSIVEHDRGHAHEVSDIWCARPLSGLFPMDLVRVSDGFVESSSESGHVAGRKAALRDVPKLVKACSKNPEP
jgi:hypothetical protein